MVVASPGPSKLRARIEGRLDTIATLLFPYTDPPHNVYYTSKCLHLQRGTQKDDIRETVILDHIHLLAGWIVLEPEATMARGKPRVSTQAVTHSHRSDGLDIFIDNPAVAKSDR